MDQPLIAQAVRSLSAARSICVSTGAGMSKESGIDTFRDEDGLWTKVDVNEMATPEAFARNPQKVWEWYRERRRRLRETEPHAGHRVLADWTERVPRFTIVTQNIDGLHHRAGSPTVLELHGRLDRVRCTGCSYELIGLDDLGRDPRCPDCESRLRPGVVWFGEMLPEDQFAAAVAAAQSCDVMLVIGTSGVVQPAASLVEMARGCGATVIEINPKPSDVTPLAQIWLQAGCRDALVALDQEWRHGGS